MDPSKQSIHDIFQKERRYLVPLYQRAYVWTRESQWEPLWQDIEQQALGALHAMRNETPLPNHFLGAVVLSGKRTVGLAHPISEVIDGQQRLTTFQLFLAALRDELRARHDEEGARSLGRLTENPENSRDPEGRHKVWPTNSDRNDYVAVTSAGSFDRVEAIRSEDASGNPVRPRMAEAYLFFAESIRRFLDGEEMPEVLEGYAVEERSEALQIALRDQLLCVVIELEDGDDPQIIFETLNARGQPLLPSDLIRNLIFLEATRRSEDTDTLYEHYWSPFDTERTGADKNGEERFWHQEVRQGRLTRPRIDLFMYHFITMQAEREIGIGQLYTEFRNWSARGVGNVAGLLEEIARAREVFRRLLDAEGDDPTLALARRARALDTGTIYPVLLFLLGLPADELPREERDAIARDLESWLVRRFVSGLTVKNYNRFFVNLLKDVKAAHREGRSLHDVIRGELLRPEGPAGRWPDDEEFLQGWLENPVYFKTRSDRSRMLLVAIERHIRTSKSENVSIPESLTVEHLLPKTWDPELHPFGSGSYMREQETEERARQRLVDTIGNLTLLTSPLNSSVGNGPTAEKLKTIDEHSLLRLNRAIELKGDRWTEDEILERGRKLFEYARVIWSPPPG